MQAWARGRQRISLVLLGYAGQAREEILVPFGTKRQRRGVHKTMWHGVQQEFHHNPERCTSVNLPLLLLGIYPPVASKHPPAINRRVCMLHCYHLSSIRTAAEEHIITAIALTQKAIVNPVERGIARARHTCVKSLLATCAEANLYVPGVGFLSKKY